MAWASRTSSYDHTLWNLGVGMGIAGDTKPTIATRVFAAYFDPCLGFVLCDWHGRAGRLSHRPAARIMIDPYVMVLCHPEPKAKDLAREQEVSFIRGSDPSLRCAPFRMTY